MTLGPPSSAAGSSQSNNPTTNAPPAEASPSAAAVSRNSAQGPTFIDQPSSQAVPRPSHNPSYATGQPYYRNSTQGAPLYDSRHGTGGSSQSTNVSSLQPPLQSAPHSHSYAYYNYPPGAWGNAWPMGTYPYNAPEAYQYSQMNVLPAAQGAQQNQSYYRSPAQPTVKTKTPSPSPSPAPEFRQQWDAVIKTFLSAVGLTQALRGFEADMIVMNPEWERKKVPIALGDLMKDLLILGEKVEQAKEDVVPNERSLDERKLDYIHLATGKQPSSQASTTKSISRFLAQTRARNNASNRAEFLQSLAEKRRRLNESGDSEPTQAIPSCARTDAKTQDRDSQMKYDIAKNEDGPLRRTLKSGVRNSAAQGQKADNREDGGTRTESASDRHPGIDERLRNIETHLAIRYVPYPPQSLLDRLKFMEDHIIQLEKEYPPWAALHFNQPNRGWPPPPRATPIIVPSHLTSAAARSDESVMAAHYSPSSPLPASSRTSPGEAAEGSVSTSLKQKGKQGRNMKSSLHRAVMEKLEVQKAMNDLAGIGDG